MTIWEFIVKEWRRLVIFGNVNLLMLILVFTFVDNWLLITLFCLANLAIILVLAVYKLMGLIHDTTY